MNKQRRKRIEEAVTLIEQAKDIIEEVSGDEEAFENLPESLQYGERGEAMQTAVDNMQTAVGSLEEAAE